jgi:hypothetical protein
MATACWCPIVAKRTPPQGPPFLDFFTLPKTNRKTLLTIYPQDPVDKLGAKRPVKSQQEIAPE